MSSAKAASEKEMFSLGFGSEFEQALKEATTAWDAAKKTTKLWNRDNSLWTGNDESNRLDWLDIVDRQLAGISKFKALAAEVQEDGVSHLLLLGASNSSLVAEAFVEAFGNRPGFPELLTLDSTDPQQVRSIRERINPAHTLFCISDSSGMTLETDVCTRHFYDELKTLVGEEAGRHFLAITDTASRLADIASALQFRRVYTAANGFSALSDYGLIPHAIAGFDTERLLRHAEAMVEACHQSPNTANPGVVLGLALATGVMKFQRDKVTLLCSQSVRGFGGWVEHLLAESTGKEGKGLVPIYNEPLLSPDAYGPDRLFVYTRFVADDDEDQDKLVLALEKGGHPVIRVVWTDLFDLGGAFVQWEIAAMVACSLLGVNPFDRTEAIASEAAALKSVSELADVAELPAETAHLDQDETKLFLGQAISALPGKSKQTRGAYVRRLLDSIRPGDYFAILAFLPKFDAIETILQDIRKEVAVNRRIATCLNFGPQFLHSTGQLFHGGPNSGVFLQLTCEDGEDIPIMESPYSFAAAKAIQARSEFSRFDKGNRRILRIHLGTDLAEGMSRLRDLIFAALAH